jgi:Family of unknown function (DUF5995)
MTVTFDRGRAGDSAETLRLERVNLSTPDPVVPGRGWAPAESAMADVLRTEPDDIAGVVARLHTIQKIMEKLPPTPALNRVAAFNSLYLTITRRVAHALARPGVTEPKFLETLDVEFAKRYLHALRLWGEDDDRTPDAWEVLFRRGQDSRLTRLTAAMLGVNAHINFDLAMALIATWELLGPPGEHIHPDYLLINKIFYQEIPGLRRRYSTPWQLDIDAVCGNLDDWGQRVLVLSTRAMAWEQAVRIWPLRADPKDFERAQLLMDRATAFLGESLIVGDAALADAGVLVTRIWVLIKRMLSLIVRLGRAKAVARM